MIKDYTFSRIIFFALLLCTPFLATGKGEPLNGPLNGSQTQSDSLAKRLGHCSAIIKPVVNCTTHTVELGAYISYLFTGIVDPVVVTWNNGQTAHTITVTPPGLWSWDASGTGCEPVHWENEYLQNGSFYQGQLNIIGPGYICPGHPGLLTVDAQGYVFPEYEWSPLDAGQQLSPHAAPVPGLYSLTVTDALGCTFSDNIQVPEGTPPTAGFTYSIDGQTVTFENTSTNANAYTWDFDNGLYSTLTNPTLTFTDPGIYEICLVASGACVDTVCHALDLSPNVPWTASPSGRNHTIILPANLSSYIEGQTLEPGDYVGMFYDFGGTPVCGGLGQWTGGNTSFAVFGNDAAAPAKNGFNTGETFKVKVWKAATNQIFEVNAGYAPVGTAGLVTHTKQFADDGISMINLLTTAVTQECILSNGWNMISSYITPQHPDMLEVLAPVASSVAIVKDGEGLSTIPALPVNGIGNWNVVKGYQVKANQQDTLRITGHQVRPELTPIALKTGWQIIAYLRDSPQNAAVAFSPVQTQIELVKDNAGKLYAPPFGINTIGNLKPGQGYKVKALANTTLTYQANFTTPVAGKPDEPLPFRLETLHFKLDSNLNTGNNATLILIDSIGDVALDSLDEIGVFTPAGVLCGAGVFEQQNLAITVWGDDPGTSALTEGMQPGEAYHFRVWDHSAQNECRGMLSFLSAVNAYEPDGFEIIHQLSFGVPTDTILTVQACENYTWDGVLYTNSGTYTKILPNAAGCDSTIILHLTIFPLPVISAAGATICQGQAATLQASGADTYLWSTGETTSQIQVSPLSGAVYTVTGAANGCAAAAPIAVAVGVVPLPAVDLGPDTLYISGGNSVLLDAGNNPAFDYQWSTGAQTPSITVSSAGLYAVTVTVEGFPECSATDAVQVVLLMGDVDLPENSALNVRPNPGSGRFEMRCEKASTSSVQVLDMTGKTVWQENAFVAAGQTRILPLEHLPTGVYAVRVSGDHFAGMVLVSKE